MLEWLGHDLLSTVGKYVDHDFFDSLNQITKRSARERPSVLTQAVFRSDAEMTEPIVMDNGSATMYAGFGGEDHPTAMFRSAHGRALEHNVRVHGMAPSV